MRRALDGAGALFQRAGRAIHATEQERRVVPWFRDNGDRTLRLDYDLGPESTVLDLGGFEGQWASDIFARYGSTIHVLEPVPEFAASIRRRFARNPRIHVHELGLSDRTEEVPLRVDRDRSSSFGTHGRAITVRLVRAADFLDAQGIGTIDLMKVNIEGGEYALLEHLITEGRIGRIRDLQVQFHDFVEEAPRRMSAIQEALGRTHALTWQYPFVWENWRLKERAP